MTSAPIMLQAKLKMFKSSLQRVRGCSKHSHQGDLTPQGVGTFERGQAVGRGARRPEALHGLRVPGQGSQTVHG